MQKSAVIFGATGLTGKALVNELLNNPEFDKIIVIVRKEAFPTESRLQQIVLPDFSNLESIKDKLKATYYFCCIGTTIKTAGSKEAFRKVDLDIPVKIAELAQELSIPSLVIVSSIGANADSGNFYLRTKGEMEKTVRNSYTGNLKIVRPSLLMGERGEKRFGEKVAVLFMKTFAGIFSGPLKKYKGIDVSVLAKAMINASSLPVNEYVIESERLHGLGQ